MGMRRTIKGEELIILEEDGWGGYVCIPVKELTPAFLEKIRNDNADEMGWKKYKNVLMEEKLIA